MPSLTTALVKADAVLTATADADIVAAETVVIDGKTYTWEVTPSADGDVKHVTGFAANMLALQKALDLTGVAGTDYDAAMTKNANAKGAIGADGVLTVTARVAGTVGNLITITIGTSAVVLSGDTSGKLDGGLGDLGEAIDDLQARGQLNSDIIEFLRLLDENA